MRFCGTFSTTYRRLWRTEREGRRKPLLFLLKRTMEKRITAKERYDAKNTVFVGLKLNRNTDQDILQALEGKAKQTEIKRLIRLALEKQKGE